MSASFIPDRYLDLSETNLSSTNTFPVFGDRSTGLLQGLARRWRRERRRRKVGRAYDMAIEIARHVPPHSQILDVGCGTGYIAHHLSALLGARVFGIDVAKTAETSIPYKQFDGLTIPHASASVDAILLCYVLHHAQDIDALMQELKRVLRPEGLVLLYEDIPETWWDRLVCSIHDRKWRNRTGACRFRTTNEWQILFNSEGFSTVNQRILSRWRNLAHPVRRNFYLFKFAV